MSPLRIYVDLDDCVAETTSRFPAVVQQLFGRTRPFEDIHSFHLDRAFDLSRQELQRLFEFVHAGDFLLELEAREGALERLRHWEAAGHEIRIVTGRPPESRRHSLEWLDRRGVAHHHFHLCDKYDRFAADGEVLHLDDVRALEFDVAVEDSLEMAAGLAGWGVEHVLLLDRPWNRDDAALTQALRSRIRRVADWEQIGRLLPE